MHELLGELVLQRSLSEEALEGSQDEVPDVQNRAA
jgi:hypothetical protein